MKIEKLSLEGVFKIDLKAILIPTRISLIKNNTLIKDWN